MVILLCSTPRRGVIAVATHGTPSGCKRARSPRPFVFAPCSPIGPTAFDPDSKRWPSKIDSPALDLLNSLDPKIDTEQENQRAPRKETEDEPVIDHQLNLKLGDDGMSATPTYGQSCFPFAVNCRFSKTFFGVPKKCGYCQKIIVGTGFACQNCRFRCHKRCIMIGRGPQVCLRPKPCSLSRLPPGDEALINKLLRESEINSNDMDSVFAEYIEEGDDTETVSEVLTNGNGSSRRQSRPSLANSSSIVRSVAPSLTTSDDPSSSSPPSPPSVSNPSSPTYPSNVVTDSSHLRPLPHRPSRPTSRQQQHNTNMLLLALAMGVDRRPSITSTSSSRTHHPAPTPSPVQCQPVATNGTSLMGKFLKLIPSWGSANKEGEPKVDPAKVDKMPRSCSVVSAASSAYTAPCSSMGQYETENKPKLPRAISSSATVASLANPGHKRPHVLSACSTTSNSAYSTVGGARTPVDEYNSSILEDLFAFPQTSTASSISDTAKSSACVNQRSQFLHRRLLWAKHMAGDRSARSQDCVNGSVVGDVGLLSRGRGATTRAGGHADCAHAGKETNGLLDNRKSNKDNEEGRSGFGPMVDDAGDCSAEAKTRERLANTWPLSGLHINHENAVVRGNDEIGNVDALDAFESSEIGECMLEDCSSDDTRHRQARLSDLGEWTIPYVDLEFGECVNECRNMTTYKGRWHGDVMIHTFDMTGAESDRLMRGFLENVRTLTKIRHENVALFMGASIEAPLVAVVTSIRKGSSLYDAVHVENRRISQHAKLNIVRQIAQGMGYLHAKGIVLKTLTSRSIYLESKVKISTLDDGAPLKQHDQSNIGCVRRGHLTYISPELMQTLRVEPPALIVSGTQTKEADVYSFGTVLFELYAGHFPFAHLAPESIVWTIGTGARQDLERVRCNVAMKSLIEDCWSPDPTYRPSFTEVLKDLHHTAALHKKHSSSVPDKLNKTGFHRSPYIY